MGYNYCYYSYFTRFQQLHLNNFIYNLTAFLNYSCGIGLCNEAAILNTAFLSLLF
jgi:hypothetical protein